MLIGLHGCKGVGKDTAAQALIDHADFTKLALADPLKDAVGALFDITRQNVDDLKQYMAWIEVRHPLSSEALSMGWREFLQRFGTEMGRRQFGENFWVDLWIARYHEHVANYPSSHSCNVVVTDVRFENEARAIMAYGGYIIEITRRGHEADGHASEERLPAKYIEDSISNNGSIKELQAAILSRYQALERGFMLT